MTGSKQERKVLGIEFIAGDTWVSAMEVESIAPGQEVEFDPDVKAYPKPFSQAPAGDYQIMALLDPDHSYPYTGQNEGDLYSSVVKVQGLSPAQTAPVDLTIDQRAEARFKTADTESTRLAELESPVLSKFWGRPIKMQAGVVLPPSFSKGSRKTYPAVYHVHGFGGDHTSAWREGARLIKAMADGKQMEMVHVFLNGHCPTGHHEFADSINNGPWGQALTQEFIPHLEKKYRLIPKPYARFLTGHSSGGWSSLWLQVTYPDYFGGTWSTSPDPVDLHSFTGIDVTPSSTDNAYKTAAGKARNLIRMNGREISSIEEFARLEDVLGEYGGQLASFEWVWSPKGEDGRPMKLFNRETGQVDPAVQRAWQKYDIRLILDQNWARLGPRLKGKINVICGTDDTFHLEEAVKLLCDFFKQKGSDAVCEMVPGRDHMNLYQAGQAYPDGLGERIQKEMAHKFTAAGPAAPGHGAAKSKAATGPLR
jgi:enterochelin esterase-like enzyme